MNQHNDRLLAEKILTYSVDLKQNENVMIQLVGLNGISLARALVEISRGLGANPFVRIDDTEISKTLVESGDEAFWELQAEIDGLPVMKRMDAFVGIRASENIYELAGASKEAHKAYAERYLHPVHFEERVKNTKWCILRYPSAAFAMNARMPTRAFESFYYDACLLEYDRLKEAMKPLEERLRATQEIRLSGPGTDIAFSVEGQNWIPCYGLRNLPDGELFTSPVLDSVNGEITYAPTVYQGKPFDFVQLKVRDGVVTDFRSSNDDALEAILETDEGARRFGEFSFGLNPYIEQTMYDILFDEKIYGSNHLTLGQDYDEAPNGNRSSVHWDLVCIGADVYFDGVPVRRGRLFTEESLLGLNPDVLKASSD